MYQINYDAAGKASVSTLGAMPSVTNSGGTTDRITHLRDENGQKTAVHPVVTMLYDECENLRETVRFLKVQMNADAKDYAAGRDRLLAERDEARSELERLLSVPVYKIKAIKLNNAERAELESLRAFRSELNDVLDETAPSPIEAARAIKMALADGGSVMRQQAEAWLEVYQYVSKLPEYDAVPKSEKETGIKLVLATIRLLVEKSPRLQTSKSFASLCSNLERERDSLKKRLDAIYTRMKSLKEWEGVTGQPCNVQFDDFSRAMEVINILIARACILREQLDEAKQPEKFFRDRGIDPKAIIHVPHGALTQGMVAAVSERARQIGVEGYDSRRDVHYIGNELVKAAVCYAHASYLAAPAGTVPSHWPWNPIHWKPSTAKRNLEKAAALLMAEWDRLDNLEKFAAAACQEHRQDVTIASYTAQQFIHGARSLAR